MTSTIRPVTRRLPISKALWDETNLPMAVVITPCDPMDDETPLAKKTVRLLTSIPKCLHCGAPHPSKTTHYRPIHQAVLLCYLCGKTSSTKFQDQQEARSEEVLDLQFYDRIIEDPHRKPLEYHIPLYNHPDNNPDNPLYSVPAMMCPPVWWIVLDGSCTVSSYWTTVGTVLEETLKDIPSHVHLGIICSSSTTLTTWDLTTPIPHAWHAPHATIGDNSNLMENLCLVPADTIHRSSILAAIRAITDHNMTAAMMVTGTNHHFTKNQPSPFGEYHSQSSNISMTPRSGMALGATLELLIEYMESEASHPGMPTPAPLQQSESSREDVPPLRYAGGKILVLLGNPPMEVQSRDMVMPQPHFYAGGVAGSCSSPLSKWDDDPLQNLADDIASSLDPTDMTPVSLKDFTAPLEPADYFAVIGTKCAKAALGVDLLIVSSDSEYENMIRPWYGVPLLRALSDRSGAPGPILCSTLTDTENENGINNTLQQQIQARRPWQSGMIFGAEVRLRISPGFEVDAAPIEPIGEAKLQLGPLLASGGLYGPATAEVEDSLEDHNLWCMGSCDPFTSLSVDLQMASAVVRDRYFVEGFGEVALKPVLQVCVAYTCVENDPEEGYDRTVRKVRVASCTLPLASQAEQLYDVLDPEALAVVLFHKLSLSSLQDGLIETQEIGQSWLRSLLVCVYQSAEIQEAERQARLQQNIDPEGGSTFVASERLLEQEGSLSVEDVLLGQGHVKIAVLPFLVYALLQCDALRPTSTSDNSNGAPSFRPSMDARSAAMGQMASMTPSALSKCIAPCLQLWSNRDDEPVLEMVDLNKKAVQTAVQECGTDDTVFFLDSPQYIVVQDAVRLSLDASSNSFKKPLPNPISQRLQAAVKIACKAYRTSPRILLDDDANSGSEHDAMACFMNALIEDKPTATGYKDFSHWKEVMASMVHE